jgi:uncharacterized protein (UPF0335 family)
MPSFNLQKYLQLRADGQTVEAACEQSGIPLGEARLHETDIERGELEMPPPSRAQMHVHAREEQSTEEDEMARDNESTIQIGDGPKIPLEDFRAAADRIAGPTVTADELRLFIERIERLSEERKGIAEDIADVYSEAKARGYDKPTMRRIVRLRAMDEHARQEAAALLETYADALGLQGALPL